MYRTILCAAAGAAIFAIPAKADETVKFHSVVHLTANNQNQRVDDVERHLLALIRAEGTVTFADGSMRTGTGVATVDIIIGSGETENGYSSVTFADGSELRFKYSQTLEWAETKNIGKGTAIITGGKGRYAGAKGDATFEGEFIRGPNGMGQFDTVVNIKK
jgi:hypothetical protein